jgi:hypothetical protein
MAFEHPSIKFFVVFDAKPTQHHYYNFQEP